MIRRSSKHERSKRPTLIACVELETQTTAYSHKTHGQASIDAGSPVREPQQMNHVTLRQGVGFELRRSLSIITTTCRSMQVLSIENKIKLYLIVHIYHIIIDRECLIPNSLNVTGEESAYKYRCVS